MATLCAVALFLLRHQRSSAAAAVCAGSSGTDQRSPIRLPLHVSELPSSSSPLRLQYNDWHAKALHRRDVGGVPRFEAKGSQSLGSLALGVSFGTARLCHLEALELYVPAAHSFELDYVSLETRSVVMELQLHHTCESLAYLDTSVEAAQDRVADLRHEDEAAEHELLKRLDDLETTSAVNVSLLADAQNALKDAKEEITKVRKSIQREQQKVESLKQDISYEEAYHRIQLAKITVVSLLLQVSDHATDDTLIDFLHCIVSEADGFCPKGAAAFQGAGRWLSGVSPRAYHYKGSLTRSPCIGPVDWFVLAHRNFISQSGFLNFSKEELGEAIEHEKHSLRNATIEVVHLAGNALPKPRFTDEEKAARTVRFSLGISLLLAFALLLHAMGVYPNNYDRATIFLLCVPCIVFMVLTGAGFTHYPSPSMDLNIGYGSMRAWHSVTQQFSWQHFGMLVVDLLFSAVLVAASPLILQAAAAVLIGSFATPSLLLPPTYLLLLWLLVKVPFVASISSALTHWCPVAACVAGLLWYGVPVTLVVLTASWLVLPAWAWATGSVTCTDGVDWEIHLTYTLVVIVLSFLWGTLRQGPLQEKNCIQRSMVFAFYTLAMADMYTDAVFICIALQCGSQLGYVALFFYLGGVVVLQLLLPALGLLFQGGRGNAQLGLWSLLLFPSELLGSSNGGYRALVLENSGDLDECDKHWVRFTVMIQAILRILAEDVPQCIVQYLFTVQVKRNPVVKLSIGISIASSAFAVGKAVCHYCQS